MDIKEIVGWLNHNLSLKWNDEIATARDLLLQQMETEGN